MSIKILRICQSIYIRDVLKEEKLTECNAPTIPIKAGSAIEMNKSDNYDEANLAAYQ